MSRVNYVSYSIFSSSHQVTHATHATPPTSHILSLIQFAVMSTISASPFSHLFYCPVFVNFAWRTTLFTPDSDISTLNHHIQWRLRMDAILANTPSLTVGTKVFISQAKMRVDEYVSHLMNHHMLALDLALSPNHAPTTQSPACLLGYKLRGATKQSFWQVFLLCVWIDRVLWAHDICPNSSPTAPCPVTGPENDPENNTTTDTNTPALIVTQLRHPFTSTAALEPLDHTQALERCSRASVFLSKEAETLGIPSANIEDSDQSVYRTQMTFLAGTVHMARSQTYAVSSNLFWLAGMAFTLMQVSTQLHSPFFSLPG